jgi:phage baseplate assembly protein W
MAILNSFSALVGGKSLVVNGAFQYDFDAPFNSVEAVLQNVYETVTTPLGSQVLFRNYGTNWDIIDQPGNLASYQAQVAVLEACARWEPRAKFLKIQLFPASAENLLAGVWDMVCELEIDLTAEISNVLYGAPGPISVWCVAGDLSSTAPPQVTQLTALI